MESVSRWQVQARHARRCSGAKAASWAARSSVGSGDRHQPAQPRRGRALMALARAGRSVGVQPDLLSSPLTLTWMQMFSGWQIGRALFGQALGDFQAIHGMHPVEMLGDSASLVRLNGADEVPDQGQVGQLGLFAQGLLQVVLAKIAQAGGISFAQGLWRVWSCSRPAAGRCFRRGWRQVSPRVCAN